MVATRQVGMPFYRGVVRQHGKGFDSLAQVYGKSAFSILRNYVVSTAKRVVVDLLDRAVPEIAVVVSDKKLSRPLQQKAWDAKL